jgi:hypothetical protein
MRGQAAVWAFLLAAATAGAQVLVPEAHVERQFADGGSIQMRLAPGEYTISGAAADHIRITYHPSNTPSGPVKVELQAEGSSASLRVRHTGHDFHADIEVPQRCDLYVRVGAGDLNVQGVAGSKDIEVHAGDVSVDVRRPDDYRKVDASVAVGDLRAPAFKVNKDGFVRSFRRSGPGPYRLHVHVGAGDVRLYQTD